MRRFTGVAAVLLASSLSHAAYASAPPSSMQVDPDSVDQASNDSFFGERSQTLLGNMWGVRPWLSQYGVSFSALETSEVLGNVTGGINKGFDYDGLTQLDVQMDTQRAFGWYGGTFNVSALQIHGRNLSQDNLGTLQTASGIEANRATRMWEMWYQQKFLNEDRLDVKVGEQSIDQEFMVSSNALLFVNTMFGWPMVPSADMPSGGPAYPLSALGARVRARPNDSITVLGGIYNGTPANSAGVDDSGTGFPLNGGILALGEIQYAYPSLGSMVSPDQTAPLAGVYKLGFWYDSEDFADQAFDTSGVSLATSATGNPMQHHGDYGIYAVADQMLWHSENFDDRSLNFFTRLMGTPQTDRNPIDFSMNAGFTLHEPIPLRDSDTVGIGLGYADVSSRLVALDQATAAANPGVYTPIQSSETFVELTYQYQVTPWWQVQPDFQYVFDPGAGAVDNNGNRIRNEAVIGVRTNIAF